MGVLNALAEMERLNTIGEQRGVNQIKSYLQAERDRDLGKRFFENYDPSPEGLQRFAADNNLGLPELARFTALVKGFEDFKNNRTDAQAAYTNALGRLTKAMAPPRPVTLTPGAAAVDPATGRVIAQRAPVPPRPVTLAPGGAAVDPATGRVIAQRAPVPQRPVTLAPGGAAVDPATGRVIAQRPAAPGTLTAAQKQAAQQKRQVAGAARSAWLAFLKNVSPKGYFLQNANDKEKMASNLSFFRNALSQALQYKRAGGDVRQLGMTKEDFLHYQSALKDLMPAEEAAKWYDLLFK